jgi:exonuclease III
LPSKTNLFLHRNEDDAYDLIKVQNRKTYFKKAFESNGRPIGGMLILVKENIKHECYYERHNLGVLILGKLAIINVYLLHNSNTAENANEFNLQLLELSKIRKQLLKCVENVIIMGDTNVDLHRKYKVNVVETICSKTRSKDFKKFLRQNNLVCVDQLSTQRIWFKFWQAKEGQVITSKIDHVMVDLSFQFEFEVNILYSRNNKSDHNPLQLCIELEPGFLDTVQQKIKSNKINWNNPNFTYVYNIELSKLLKSFIQDTLVFVHRNEIRTKKFLETMIMNLTTSAKQAVNIALYKTADVNKHRKVKPWWDDELVNHHAFVCARLADWAATEFKDKNKQAELITARKEFNKLNRYKEKLKRNARVRNLDKLFRLNKQEFWSQMRKMKRDNTKLKIDIEKMKQKYEELFNQSLISNESKRKEAEAKLKELLESNENDFNKIEIRTDDIEQIIKNLPNNKKAGVNGISNEHIKYGLNEELVSLLKQIYEVMINTGIFPDDFNIALVTPLVKDKNILDDPSNTRPISVADVLTNLFEKIMLKRIDAEKRDEEEQFGFKSNSSCGHAITVLMDAALFNRRKALRLYVVAIDATKAFDKVNRTILWAKLLSKLSKTTVRALKNYYNISKAIVDLNNCKSEVFKTTIGVKQGGSLSPRLFSIYVEDLIVLLRKSKYGMNYEYDQLISSKGNKKLTIKRKIECLFYADDIIIMASIKKQAQELLNIVEKYGQDYEILFNVGKTYTMIFNHKIKRNKADTEEDAWQDELKLNNNVITKTNCITYLGIEVSDDLKNTLHLEKRRSKALAAFFILKELGLTSGCISIKFKAQMYKTYVRPVLYYGLENINLNQTEKGRLQRIESNLIKMCIGISKYCHSTQLLLALNIESAQSRLIINKCNSFIRLVRNNYTKKHLKSQISMLRKEDYPEKTKCTINYVRDMLLESSRGKLVLELDYDDLSLKDLVSRCKTKLVDIKIKNSYIVRYNSEINEIKKIINEDENTVAIKIIEDRLLPDKFKIWPAEKQQSIVDECEPECFSDFGENK